MGLKRLPLSNMDVFFDEIMTPNTRWVGDKTGNGGTKFHDNPHEEHNTSGPFVQDYSVLRNPR